MICVFRGALLRDAELKSTSHGREFLKFIVTEGEGKRAQLVSVLGWRDTFTELAPRLRKGTEVLVRGKLELRHWDSPQGPQHGLSVSAEEIAIADVSLDDVRKKPRAGKKANGKAVDSQKPIGVGESGRPFDDSLPF